MTSFLNPVYVRLLNAYASARDREEGQGLVEYVVLVAAVAVMVTTLVGVLTGSLTTYINSLISNLPTP